MEKEVEARVKALLAEPKASGKKFEDPDFGPTTDDEYGAKVYANIQSLLIQHGQQCCTLQHLNCIREHQLSKVCYAAVRCCAAL
jgi:hypothetical protein